MTIGTTSPMKEKSPGRNKQIVDEKVPLLPTKQGKGEFNWASFTGAVFNLSTTVIGAGIMALPATMKVLGLIPGITIIIFMAFLTEASIELLTRFSKAAETVSYGGVMGDAFGTCGKILLQISVLVNNVGVLIVYMIIIDSLRFTSALSVALAIAFLVITVGITLIKLISRTIQMPRLFPDVPDFMSLWKLFTVVPVLVTAYICHYNVHTIHNELDDSSQIRGVVRSSLGLCSTVYVLTSLFGFLLFGEETLDDVLANFDKDLGIPYGSLLNDCVRVSYAAHLMLVFPIVFYPLRVNLDGLLFPSARPMTSDNWSSVELPLRFVLDSYSLPPSLLGIIMVYRRRKIGFYVL